MKVPSESNDFPDKRAVREALRQSMQGALAAVAHAAKDAAAGATHEENRAEGDKDMRATEQSYIARGQAIRAEELAEHFQRLASFDFPDFSEHDPIAPGALIRVFIDATPRFFLMVPWGGGTEIAVGSTKITVISVMAPFLTLIGELALRECRDPSQPRGMRQAVDLRLGPRQVTFDMRDLLARTQERPCSLKNGASATGELSEMRAPKLFPRLF